MQLVHDAVAAAPATTTVKQLTIDNPGCSSAAGRNLHGIISSHICQSLGGLRLVRWPLDRSTDVTALARRLLPLSNLRVLSLENCGIVGAGLIPLGALLHNGVLEQLALPHNVLANAEDYPSCGLTPAVPTIIGVQPALPPEAPPDTLPSARKAEPSRTSKMSLSGLPSLRKMPPKRDELGLALAQALSGNWALASVYEGVTLGRAALVFASAVSSPFCRLNRLDLSFCSISDDIGVPLALSLATNSSLTFLDVSHNRLTGTFARTTSQSLRTNTVLRELRAGFQPLGIEGARELLQVVSAAECSLFKNMRLEPPASRPLHFCSPSV